MLGSVRRLYHEFNTLPFAEIRGRKGVFYWKGHLDLRQIKVKGAAAAICVDFFRSLCYDMVEPIAVSSKK